MIANLWASPSFSASRCRPLSVSQFPSLCNRGARPRSEQALPVPPMMVSPRRKSPGLLSDSSALRPAPRPVLCCSGIGVLTTDNTESQDAVFDPGKYRQDCVSALFISEKGDRRRVVECTDRGSHPAQSFPFVSDDLSGPRDNARFALVFLNFATVPPAACCEIGSRSAAHSSRRNPKPFGPS